MVWNAYECHFETKSISCINLPYNKIINYCHALKTSEKKRLKKFIQKYKFAYKL